MRFIFRAREKSERLYCEGADLILIGGGIEGFCRKKVITSFCQGGTRIYSNFSDSKLRWMRWLTPADLIYLGFNWWIINETFSLMNRKSTNIHWKGCKIIFPLCCADKSARQDKCITATLLYGCHKMLHRRIWNLPNPRTSGGTVRGWGRLMVLRLALFHSSLFLFCSYPHSSAEDFSH